MLAFASLCFDKNGLINPDEFKLTQNCDTLVLHGDGSHEAHTHMMTYDYAPLLSQFTKIGIAWTPLFEMRVVNANGSMSQPSYMSDDDVRMAWICSRICPHHLKISVYDISSQSDTRTALSPKLTEAVCRASHKLWTMFQIAEDRLCFPAVVLDRMARWTYHLTPETIKIDLLRNEVGLDSFAYSPVTDMLSVEVGGQIFTAKMAVVNAYFTEVILPVFNSMYGRRRRMMVSVVGAVGQVSEPVAMTYGELGRLVDEMKSYAYQRQISQHRTIDPQDLLSQARKIKPNDESCVWKAWDQSVAAFVAANTAVVMPDHRNHNHKDDATFTIEPSDLALVDP